MSQSQWIALIQISLIAGIAFILSWKISRRAF